MAVGILGGRFDPPHVGHLVTAVNVRHALDLDEVLRSIVSGAVSLTGADSGLISLRGRDEVHRRAIGGEEDLGAFPEVVDAWRGLHGRVVATGRPHTLDDYGA